MMLFTGHFDLFSHAFFILEKLLLMLPCEQQPPTIPAETPGYGHQMETLATIEGSNEETYCSQCPCLYWLYMHSSFFFPVSLPRQHVAVTLFFSLPLCLTSNLYGSCLQYPPSHILSTICFDCWSVFFGHARCFWKGWIATGKQVFA